jgi:hypothetical protein
MEDGPAHSGGSHEEHPAASPAEDHCSQHLKLQEKAKRKVSPMAWLLGVFSSATITSLVLARVPFVCTSFAPCCALRVEYETCC